MAAGPPSSSVWNYQVTAQKPTAVSHCAVGSFTSKEDLNLIVAKCTVLEIHLLSPEGLVPVLETNIYGRISVLELFQPPGEDQHLLFILTERYKFCILSYDSTTGEIVTRANGDSQDRMGHPSDSGQLGAIDPDCRTIGLRLYNGLFKAIPIGPKSQLQEAFNIRLEELNVLDLVFLHNCSKPTICILYQDTKDGRHVKTYEVLLRDKEFGEGPWQQMNVENGAMMLIPVATGGVLIVGETTITHHNGVQHRAINMSQPTAMMAYGQVDESRFLLGDQRGGLYILLLLDGGDDIADLKLEPLGETSAASCLAYLDNSVVFVGSRFGDSQLVRLTTEPDDVGSYLQIMDSFANLGPIVDFCMVDLDRQGQGQLVTCSGAFHNGSLRVIRNGIGINELTQIDLPGVKGIWSLRASSGAEYDAFLAIAFISELRVLAIKDDEMEESVIEGMVTEGLTLYCGNMVGDQLLQVTESAVVLVSCCDHSLSSKWDAPAGCKINVATANSVQVVISTGGGTVIYFEVDGKNLKEISRTTLPHEVACLDVSPLGDSPRADVVAAGLWTDITVRLLALPDMKEVTKDALGGEVIPRSILFASLEGVQYLLVGLGDGHFFSYIVDTETGTLGDRKKLSLGTQPVTLSLFRSNGAAHVFAASDRPTVVYSSAKKLLYSNVNLKEVSYMCPFNSADFPDSLVLASEASLTIGSIDEIQKLHKQTVPLGEMARRIVHQEQTSTFAVVTVHLSPEDENVETNYVRILDDQTFEVLRSFELDVNEAANAIVSTTFSGDDTPYIVVGTAYVLPKEPEPLIGRILVLKISRGENECNLTLVTEVKTKGSTYCLEPFNGKLLAGITSKIQLYKWAGTEGSRLLQPECGHHGHIIALRMRSHCDFILVGDLMKSMSLLVYKPVDGTIEEVARDYNSAWMTDVSILDDATFLGAETYFNLFTVAKNTEATSDEERGRLEVVGEYHLGEFVNKFQHGSLVMRLPETDPIPTVIYGTVNGAIGVVASLPMEQFAFLSKVQQRMTKVVKGVGGFKHEFWRSFCTDKRTVDARGFVDGDLIEAYLDLPPEKMEEVVQTLDISAEELYRKIEDLARRLH